MSESNFSLLLAGDALMVRPWSHDRDPAFLGLIDEIRTADVAVANLETVVHEFKGYAQADSGGAYMHSPPQIAAELAWAGFDMLAHANNHAFDYGSSAVLETIAHVEAAGLAIAGSGVDLQRARSPRYFENKGFKVALIAMASTFTPYGKASRSRPDFHGRPGVNPLAAPLVERAVVVPPRWAALLRKAGRLFGAEPAHLAGASFRVGLRFREGERFGYWRGRRIAERDLDGNLDAIADAARCGAFVLVSIHAHRQGHWLETFAAQAIDHGAGAVFIHGPHRVGAVQLHRGKPIFYSMGDFVYEPEFVEKYPSDAYEKLGLDDDATPEDLVRATDAVISPALRSRDVFEGFVAKLEVLNGTVMRIRLTPVDLRFDAKGDGRGRPRLADPDLGRKIIETVAAMSEKYGTRIRYDAVANCGEVECAV